MRGEDAQLDLREADLQVLKVVALGRSHVFVGLLMEVFIQLLQLCFPCNQDLFWLLSTKKKAKYSRPHTAISVATL